MANSIRSLLPDGGITTGPGGDLGWFGTWWSNEGTGIEHAIVFHAPLSTLWELRQIAHWMLDILPDDELPYATEELASRASYYDSAALPFVDISQALATPARG